MSSNVARDDEQFFKYYRAMIDIFLQVGLVRNDIQMAKYYCRTTQLAESWIDLSNNLNKFNLEMIIDMDNINEQLFKFEIWRFPDSIYEIDYDILVLLLQNINMHINRCIGSIPSHIFPKFIATIIGDFVEVVETFHNHVKLEDVSFKIMDEIQFTKYGSLVLSCIKDDFNNNVQHIFKNIEVIFSKIRHQISIRQTSYYSLDRINRLTIKLYNECEKLHYEMNNTIKYSIIN